MGMALGIGSMYALSCGDRAAGENESCTPESGCSYGRVCVGNECVEKTYTCEDLAQQMAYVCLSSEGVEYILTDAELDTRYPVRACYSRCRQEDPTEECVRKCEYDDILLRECGYHYPNGVWDGDEWSQETIQNMLECCHEDCDSGTRPVP